MAVAARIARLAASLCIALTICRVELRQTRKVSPPSGRVGVPRSGRVVTPRPGGFSQRPSGRLVSPRRVTPRVRSQGVQPQGNRRVQRVITPRSVTPLAPKARTPIARSTGQSVRPSLRRTSHWSIADCGATPDEPSQLDIQHDPNRKAGRSGWMHQHRPFFFKHAGHRWHRYYYSFLAGGLWYWYWYDVSGDTVRPVTLYDDAALPDCDRKSTNASSPKKGPLPETP